MIAVGTLPLHLPSGLVLDLNNCYLMRDNYSFKSENNGCSVYMSNIFYGHAPLMSGLFLLNLDSSDMSILHHAFISIFIALWDVITHYVTILMPFLSYFTRFT